MSYVPWHGLLGVAFCALVVLACIRIGELVERRRQDRQAVARIRRRTLERLNEESSSNRS